MRRSRVDRLAVLIPPTRLCECGHTYFVHSRGWCGIVQGCECQAFVEAPAINRWLHK